MPPTPPGPVLALPVPAGPPPAAPPPGAPPPLPPAAAPPPAPAAPAGRRRVGRCVAVGEKVADCMSCHDITRPVASSRSSRRRGAGAGPAPRPRPWPAGAAVVSTGVTAGWFAGTAPGWPGTGVVGGVVGG